jgi:hypothetical protein
MSFAIDTFDKERFGLITGSKCSVLFPDRGDGKKGMRSYAKLLAKEMFFQFYDEKSTWQMEHGKMAEHFAFLHYHEKISSKIDKGSFVKKGDCGGTIDAKIPGVKIIDFKCPTSLDEWLEYMFEPLSKEQVNQCQMYMYLENLPEAEIAAYLTETQYMNDNGLVYPVKEKDRMIIRKVPRDHTWEWRLEAPAKYVISERNEFVKALQQKFNKTLVSDLTF